MKWFSLIIIMLLSLGLADCGKKGPPVPPDEPEQESPYPANREDRGNRREPAKRRSKFSRGVVALLYL